MRLERLDFTDFDWKRLEGFQDHLVFQTPEWMDFVARTQGADPVIASIHDGDELCGYFTGLIVRRFGFSILGSPMPGWTTAFMGFNLEPGASRREATEALLEFGFGELGCQHLEMRDRNLTLEDVEGMGFDHTPWRGREIDLRQSEEEIMGGMKRMARKAIRKSERDGVVIEEAEPEGFAEEHFSHVEDVFAKQSLVPPYDQRRIEEMIRDVYPTGRLLLLRARAPEGISIASGIFPGLNRMMHFVTSGSLRSHQGLRPNEAIVWYAIRWGKARGFEACDLGGYMSYKEKYGGSDVHLPFLRKSRSARVGRLRNLAETAVYARQRLSGALRSRGKARQGPPA